MKHELIQKIKTLLGEDFVRSINTISYGDMLLKAQFKPNKNRVRSMKIYVHDNGNFLVESVRQVQYGRKIGFIKDVCDCVVPGKLNEIVNSMLFSR